MSATTVARKTWTEPHPPRNGAPAAFDRMEATIDRHHVGGRPYLKEIVRCNDTIILMSDYPDGTAYAARRLAKWTN